MGAPVGRLVLVMVMMLLIPAAAARLAHGLFPCADSSTPLSGEQMRGEGLHGLQTTLPDEQQRRPQPKRGRPA
jgi:hypothetical protein